MFFNVFARHVFDIFDVFLFFERFYDQNISTDITQNSILVIFCIVW